MRITVARPTSHLFLVPMLLALLGLTFGVLGVTASMNKVAGLNVAGLFLFGAFALSTLFGAANTSRLEAISDLHDHLGLSKQLQHMADQHLTRLAEQLYADFDEDRIARENLKADPTNLELRRKAGSKQGTAHAMKEAFWDFHKTVKKSGLKTRKSYKDYLPEN